MPRKAICADRSSSRSTSREYRKLRRPAAGATIDSMASAWLDDRGALAIGFDTVATQMDGVILAAEPRFELILVVRTAGHAGIADVLHGEKRIRGGEVDHDAVLRTGTRGMRRQFAAGVAQRMRSTIDLARANVERGVAQRMAPVRLVDAAPLPCRLVGTET